MGSGHNAHAPNQDKSKDGDWQSQFLDTVGDGTGNINMAVDGTDSVTYPNGYASFKVTVPVGRSYFLTRMIGAVETDGRFASGGFGTGPILSNGIEIWRCGNPVSPERPDYEWTYQHKIQTNIDYGHYCYDVNVTEWSNSYQSLLWRYTITKDAVGGTFWLREGESLCCRISDDLASRVSQHHIRLAFLNVDNNYIYT